MNRMKMRILPAFVLVIATLYVALAPVCADTSSAHENTNQAVRETIKLTRLAASDIVKQLLDENDNKPPLGIEKIKGIDVDNSVYVWGEKSAIDRLRERIAALDVEPQQIYARSKWQFLTQKQTKELQITWRPINRKSNGLLGSFIYAGPENDLMTRLRSLQPIDYGGPIQTIVGGRAQDLTWLGNDEHRIMLMNVNVTASANKDCAITVHAEGWVRVSAKSDATPSGATSLPAAGPVRPCPDFISYGSNPIDRGFICDRTVENNRDFVFGGVVLPDGSGMALVGRLEALPVALNAPSQPTL